MLTSASYQRRTFAFILSLLTHACQYQSQPRNPRLVKEQTSNSPSKFVWSGKNSAKAGRTHLWDRIMGLTIEAIFFSIDRASSALERPFRCVKDLTQISVDMMEAEWKDLSWLFTEDYNTDSRTFAAAFVCTRVLKVAADKARFRVTSLKAHLM